MSILFSPIGTADPVTLLGDGPMLHIVRKYKPEKVVLFLSPAMAQNQRLDARYTKAIEMLVEESGENGSEVAIIESNQQDVHVYDYYIDEFESILKSIREDNQKATILVNTSSGTPAMQQALVALDAFGRLNLKPLQVSTPRKGPNKQDDRENPDRFDLATLWELVRELERDSKDSNRILEVSSPNFGDRLLRESIRTLIRQYDYAAASKLAAQVRNIQPELKELIEVTELRLNLDAQRPVSVFGGTDCAFDRANSLSEYLYMLEVRLAQEQWADFLRAMTPAVTETMLNVLDPYVHRSRYMIQTPKGKLEQKLDIDKISADEGLGRLFSSFLEKGKPPYYLTNDPLLDLIRRFSQDDSELEKLQALRDLERKCRNHLAHEIKQVNKERIEREGGITLEKAMSYFFELNGTAPGLYSRINMIIEELL